MTLSLDPHPDFQGRSGPVLVVVADGVGIAPDAPVMRLHRHPHLPWMRCSLQICQRS